LVTTTADDNIIPFPGIFDATSTADTASAGDDSSSNGYGSRSHPRLLRDSVAAWTREHVWKIRHNKQFNDDQKRRILFNFIVTQENRKIQRGAFLRTTDGRAYLFDGRRRKLYRIDERDPEFRGYLQVMYGLNSSEQFTRHIISALYNTAIATGSLREVRRFSYWDHDRQTLYISRYDGTCYVIDGNEIEIRDNGYGSAVFLDDDGGTNCDVPPDDGPIVGNNRLLFRHLIDDLNYVPTTTGHMSPAIQRTCLGIWMFAIAFPDLLPAKPILLVEGEPGSGKSLALQRLAFALHGKSTSLTIPKKEDPDFGVKILRSPLAIIEDVNTHIEWLQDMLCSYTTGGAWSKRKLYTDDVEHVIRPQSFLHITSNNPATFRQRQLADRCLIIRLDRRDGNFGAADQLIERVRDWRPQLQGEWLYWLNEIVGELRRPQPPVTSAYRMADFARLAHLIGRVLNQPAGPVGDWSPAAIEQMLAAMQTERDLLVVGEGDTLVELLDRWLDTASNQGREIRLTELYRELAALARLQNQSFFRSPKGLGVRLREAGNALARHFAITQATVDETTVYTFRRL
jgi:hypothetical protein